MGLVFVGVSYSNRIRRKVVVSVPGRLNGEQPQLGVAKKARMVKIESKGGNRATSEVMLNSSLP